MDPWIRVGWRMQKVLRSNPLLANILFQTSRSDRCVEVIRSTDQHFQVLQLVSALKFAYNYLQLSIYEGRIFFERKYITTVNSSCPEYKVYTTTAVLSVILQQSTSNCYHGRTQSEFSTHRANISRVLRCHLT